GRSADGGQNPCAFRRRRARRSETDTCCDPQSKCYKAKIVVKRERRKGGVCYRHVAPSVLNTIAPHQGVMRVGWQRNPPGALAHLPADQITGMDSVSTGS